MKTITRSLLVLAVVTVLSGCSGSSGGPSTSSSTNKFTSSGSAITIDSITSSVSGSSLTAQATSQVYYGRVLYVSGSNLYAASIHFTLNKDSSTAAYFSNFSLDRLVQVSSITAATAVVSSPMDLNVTAAYNSSTNGLSITNATSRFVRFNLDFGDNTHFADVTNAGVIFSSDFSTMVGGNNSSFFFIAQKASSMASVSNSDLVATWSLANFTVSGAGSISVSSTSSVSVSGTGGHGLNAFTGINSNVGAFKGEVTLNDSGTGVYLFGYDTSGGSGTPTADGQVDGGFLLSPDKQFILGYSIYDGVYFAASR